MSRPNITGGMPLVSAAAAAGAFFNFFVFVLINKKSPRLLPAVGALSKVALSATRPGGQIVRYDDQSGYLQRDH
jgi:hypothetical protein